MDNFFWLIFGKGTTARCEAEEDVYELLSKTKSNANAIGTSNRIHTWPETSAEVRCLFSIYTHSLMWVQTHLRWKSTLRSCACKFSVTRWWLGGFELSFLPSCLKFGFKAAISGFPLQVLAWNLLLFLLSILIWWVLRKWWMSLKHSALLSK